MTTNTTNDANEADAPDPIQEPRLWCGNGWTARVVKNEDDEGWAVEMTLDGESEPALIGPWTMGRDKKNPNLFITTTLFIIAGLLSSLGAVERVQAMVSGIGFIAVSSRETLEVRILVLIGIFVFAFFKFTWSLRQFNFTLMLFASAPMPAEKDAPDRADFAPRAAMMVTHGFASFNRGLRAYFFGLAALAWFIQPWALVLASSWVVAVLYWRDSRSATLATLAGPVTEKGLP